MPRLPPGDRLVSVAEAATDVFGRLGYRGTKTADVASKAGMSTGSLFTYVESKEALFHVVFLHGFELFSEAVPELPVATPKPGATVAVIKQGLGKVRVPRIRAALAADVPTDVAVELREIVEERYDLIERYWRLLAVIERCAVEMPDLEAAWFGGTRPGSFSQLARYLQRRTAAGLLRPMPDFDVAARVVTESLSWFAFHRHQGRDANLYADEAVRRTVVEFICAALVPEPPR